MFNLKITVPETNSSDDINEESVAGIDDTAPQKIKDIYSAVEKELSKRKENHAYKDFLENSYQISFHNRENEKSSIYKKNNKNQIMKVIEGSSQIEPNIIREITMQKYAYNLRDTCDFDVPQIYKYGKILQPPNVLYYIIMEYIDAPTLSKTNKAKTLKEKTELVNDCLKRNKLFHNDYHIENILVGKNDKLSVIDYGRATPTPQVPEDTFFGGTKRQKQKRNRKTKNKRTRNKKNL